MRAQPSLSREGEPAVTSRKLGLPLGGEKVRVIGLCARLLGPPFCLGVCPGSSEHSSYSKCYHQWKLSEGARKMARGRGQDSRPPVPVLPTPPSLMCCFILPFGKEGMPSLWGVLVNNQMVSRWSQPHLAEKAASASDPLYGSWCLKPHHYHHQSYFRDEGFLCTDLSTFSSSEQHTGNATLRVSMFKSVFEKRMDVVLMAKSTVIASSPLNRMHG